MGRITSSLASRWSFKLLPILSLFLTKLLKAMISIKTDDSGKVITKYNGPAPGADGWTELPDSEWPDVDYPADYYYSQSGNGEITAEEVDQEASQQ